LDADQWVITMLSLHILQLASLQRFDL
jgi:hypothetical protein